MHTVQIMRIPPWINGSGNLTKNTGSGNILRVIVSQNVTNKQYTFNNKRLMVVINDKLDSRLIDKELQVYHKQLTKGVTTDKAES
jgi:hypothetical protein